MKQFWWSWSNVVWQSWSGLWSCGGCDVQPWCCRCWYLSSLVHSEKIRRVVFLWMFDISSSADSVSRTVDSVTLKVCTPHVSSHDRKSTPSSSFSSHYSDFCLTPCFITESLSCYLLLNLGGRGGPVSATCVLPHALYLDSPVQIKTSFGRRRSGFRGLSGWSAHSSSSSCRQISV